jgi:dCMP deaminase
MDYEALMHQALLLAQDSPDPSTQNSALIVNSCGTVLGAAVNRPPVTGFPDQWERPAKYAYTEHAERGSIYDAAKHGKTTDGMAMICPWFACADCARAIICAGIYEVVGLVRSADATHGRWAETCRVGDAMLNKAGVHTIFIDQFFGVTLRRAGQELSF